MPKARVAIAAIALYLALGSARTEPIVYPTQVPSYEFHWNPHESEGNPPIFSSFQKWS